MQDTPGGHLQLFHTYQDRINQFHGYHLQKYHQSDRLPLSLQQQHSLHLQKAQKQRVQEVSAERIQGVI